MIRCVTTPRALRHRRGARVKARWRFVAMLVTLAATRSLAEDGNPPPREAGESAVALWPLPATTEVGRHSLVVSRPDDPELTTLGGSGGPILQVTSTGEPGPVVTGTIQAIWLYATSGQEGAPPLSVWSKTGVSSYVKCRYEAVGSRYCARWCQDYEVDHPTATPVGERRSRNDCERR